MRTLCERAERIAGTESRAEYTVRRGFAAANRPRTGIPRSEVVTQTDVEDAVPEFDIALI